MYFAPARAKFLARHAWSGISLDTGKSVRVSTCGLVRFLILFNIELSQYLSLGSGRSANNMNKLSLVLGSLPTKVCSYYLFNIGVFTVLD